MSDEVLEVVEDEVDDSETMLGTVNLLREQKKMLEDAFREVGLEGQVSILFEPVTMDLDVSMTAYAAAKLLGLTE